MKTWIKKVYGFGIASFCSDFSHEMTISLVPVLVSQFVGPAQTPFFLGIISSITDSFSSLVKLISGFLTDYISRKKPLIALGYGMSTLFSTLVGFTHSVGGLLLCRMLSFTGSALREPPRDALIAATVESSYYGRAFGLKNAMDTLGALIGPLITFLLVGIVSVQNIFLLSFIPGIAAVFAIIFLTQDLAAPTKKIIFSISSWWRDVLSLPRSFIMFFGILIIFDLSSFNKLLLLARAQEILNTPNVTTSLVLLYAIFNIIRAASEFGIGLLSDYVNRILLLSVFGCGALAATAFFLITPHASFLYCACVFGLAGISTAAVTTLKKACAADMLPENIRGLGFGTLQAGEGFAALIANTLIGFLWTHYSATIGFSYVMLLSLSAMILLFIFGLSYKRVVE